MTTKNPAYRVIAFTGRVVEELAERPTEGEAREIFRASVFPAALVFPGGALDMNRRGKLHADAFERFVEQPTARSMPRARRAQPVPVEPVPERRASAFVEAPAVEELGPESFGGDEYRSDEAPVEEPIARVCEFERHAAFAESQAESLTLGGPATAADRDAREVEQAPAAVVLCVRDDCDDPRQNFTEQCHPALRVFCKRHRTHAMVMRSKRGITAEEAAAVCIALGAAPRAEAPPVEPAEEAAEPEHSDVVDEPVVAVDLSARPWRSVVEMVDDLGGVEALAQLAPVVRRAGGVAPVIALVNAAFDLAGACA